MTLFPFWLVFGNQSAKRILSVNNQNMNRSRYHSNENKQQSKTVQQLPSAHSVHIKIQCLSVILKNKLTL